MFFISHLLLQCSLHFTFFFIYLFEYNLNKYFISLQKENFTSPNTSNKLYTQLTISSKPLFGAAHKETKLPALKKRRSSTSDKPTDVTIGDGPKKNKIIETFDIYSRSNLAHPTKIDNPVFFPENNIDKKCDGKIDVPIITANGKSSSSQVLFIFIY